MGKDFWENRHAEQRLTCLLRRNKILFYKSIVRQLQNVITKQTWEERMLERPVLYRFQRGMRVLALLLQEDLEIISNHLTLYHSSVRPS